MIDRIRGLYFSSHHLTRDLIGNIAPLTAFAALVIAFYAKAQEIAASVFSTYLANASFWAIILLLIAYAVGGYFAGSVVGFAAHFLHRTLERIPKFGEEFSYTYWYNKDAKGIDNLYVMLFPNYLHLSAGAAVTPTDKINTLKQYLRKYDPQGFAEVYRQFMKVDLVRASLFYSLLLVLYELCRLFAKGTSANLPVIAISSFVLIMAIFELPRRIRKVVRTEYFFIIAAARIRENGQTDTAQ